MKWLGLEAPTSNEATSYQFVGPNSDNTNLRPWSRDWNNFAPHVGFSWQLPWWGKGLTTLRGGYSISYMPINNFDNYSGIIGTVPGTSYAPSMFAQAGTHVIGDSNHTLNYTDLGNVGNIVGAKGADGKYLVKPPIESPMNPFRYINADATIYDENLRNPYTHSISMALTRQFGRALTLDVRYIGNLSRNMLSITNLNTPNYMSNGLFEEFEALRAQGSATPLARIPIIRSILGEAAPGTISSQYGIFNLVPCNS
jgi:hypothetical protein